MDQPLTLRHNPSTNRWECYVPDVDMWAPCIIQDDAAYRELHANGTADFSAATRAYLNAPQLRPEELLGMEVCTPEYPVEPVTATDRADMLRLGAAVCCTVLALVVVTVLLIGVGRVLALGGSVP